MSTVCRIEVNVSQVGILLQRLENHAEISVRQPLAIDGTGCRVVLVESDTFPAEWAGHRIEVVEDRTHKSGISFRLWK